ncbi:hypothetical protein MPTK1_4g02380 [Marchantia polymorpha subsp. ruderalis]|uniref:Uncharacterized protein n=2 Tax=Marchantia polymorpha TaxID=3197 RepID=A0AAF6B5H5_MARPO|nr:hypothetical protein MARPO_0080s0060 [Marchantia polymorpha]BBN07259.1 hypothetical protein Mp_4g02380 [Marchantia polymorpha subsp. ruderalis]|eukprot:PTQ34444.1 hypothetical protein MARPO_0080s0060 [Marchantia polymorpha]
MDACGDKNLFGPIKNCKGYGDLNIRQGMSVGLFPDEQIVAADTSEDDLLSKRIKGEAGKRGEECIEHEQCE